ncbi:epidermal growth factor receptor substrate 15-like 1 isoform X2 [Camponotus floridanus]|uniref:epidermal growth factor receptor substrate 15-like 1 isoform X2 n=1 Tax=Camponotus floridanus TaxID=104421 RepID=UPI000DC6804C|nr:epidermal growth factor receptor substrate 15-like 1 isoform X2 [Camponotus floridanus]
MAALPSPTQVAGSHSAIYEAYYNQVDPNGFGQIEAMDAARFLKKSQLSDVILSKIWDMADPQSRGFLDKSGLFVALKLCALAQTGKDLNMSNLSLELPPPKMGDIPIPQKTITNALPVITSVNNGDWSINPTERAKYDQLFDSLQPSNGYISGHKVKGVLMDSKLPLDTLGKIWDLADMDKDGMLDRHEFVVAMHLVYKALEKYAIPNVLPPELMPLGKRKDIIPKAKSPIPISVVAIASPSSKPPPIPPLPNTTVAKNLTGLDVVKTNMHQWVVSIEDQIIAEKLFLQADMDRDGFVSGLEIKDVFLQSGLPHPVLAHIWSLCDTCQNGKLNKEQFALAMWFIKQKLNGIDPPANLTSEMIPPSMRKVGETIVENNNISGYSNPELDMISKDIAELVRERQNMEQDIAQKEADIKIKNGEIKSLQSELDTLAATLKQLGNQKGEAQKRLNDLKAQVDKLRQQAEEQESVLKIQEDELNLKRQELEGLRQEEQQLEQQQNKNRDQLNELTKKLQDTQLEICQAKAKITHLQEQQRQMSDVIALYDSALAAGNVDLVPDTSLQFIPEIEDIEYETKNTNETKETKVDTFSDGIATLDEFEEQDLFATNKAKEAFSTPVSDPFGNAFSAQPSNGNFTTDPFTAFDNTNTITKQDPFDPFDNGKQDENKTSTIATSNAKDPFGDDPFANLHAPPRPESPSPALPPKKAKQPPPRPAPPRPSQGPTGPLRAAPAPPTPSPTPDPFTNVNSDPFSVQQTTIDNNNTFASSTGFADFTNFDSKPEPAAYRTASSRLTNKTHIMSGQLKLSDFTEDPFRDYRYEDLFNITDPFADETEDLNANKNNGADRMENLFDFGTTSTFSDKNALSVKTFDNDFTSTFPHIKTKVEKSNINKFNVDFGKAFSVDNKNTRGIETDFAKVKTRTIDLDEAFSIKNAKTITKHESDVVQTSKYNTCNDEKLTNNFGKMWNGNNVTNLSEEEQLAWAEKQSIKAEEERLKLKEKEDAELALAIELSRQGKSENV